MQNSDARHVFGDPAVAGDASRSSRSHRSTGLVVALSMGPFELVYLLHFLLGESIAAKIESVKGTLSHLHNLFLMQSFTGAAIKPPARNKAAWNQKRK
jgi:hypothetical protein